MMNYNHEHRPRGGNNGFIGNGRFRHNWQVAVKAEQRKDYEQAHHFYAEAERAANNEKHRAHAANRKDTCEHKLMGKSKQLIPVKFTQPAPVTAAKQEQNDTTAALRNLLAR